MDKFEHFYNKNDIAPKGEEAEFFQNRCYIFKWLWKHTNCHAEDRPQIIHSYFEDFVLATDTLIEKKGGVSSLIGEPQRGLIKGN